VREHRESELAEDRYHFSEATLVPAIVVTEDGAPLTKYLHGTDMVVWLGRYVDDSLDWIVIEPAERSTPSLILTAESARLLARAIEQQVTRVRSLSRDEEASDDAGR
jgi:hypothetical protein